MIPGKLEIVGFGNNAVGRPGDFSGLRLFFSTLRGTFKLVRLGIARYERI